MIMTSSIALHNYDMIALYCNVAIEAQFKYISGGLEKYTIKCWFPQELNHTVGTELDLYLKKLLNSLSSKKVKCTVYGMLLCIVSK